MADTCAPRDEVKPGGLSLTGTVYISITKYLLLLLKLFDISGKVGELTMSDNLLNSCELGFARDSFGIGNFYGFLVVSYFLYIYLSSIFRQNLLGPG